MPHIFIENDLKNRQPKRLKDRTKLKYFSYSAMHTPIYNNRNYIGVPHLHSSILAFSIHLLSQHQHYGKPTI